MYSEKYHILMLRHKITTIWAGTHSKCILYYKYEEEPEFCQMIGVKLRNGP